MRLAKSMISQLSPITKTVSTCPGTPCSTRLCISISKASHFHNVVCRTSLPQPRSLAKCQVTIFHQNTCSRQPPGEWTLPHQSRWCTPFNLPREVLVIAHLSTGSHSRQGASIRAPSAPGFAPLHQLYPARVLCMANQQRLGRLCTI